MSRGLVHLPSTFLENLLTSFSRIASSRELHNEEKSTDQIFVSIEPS